MNYQDKWEAGVLKEKGMVECSTRYNAIKEVIEEVKPKRILDIGTESGYFCFRIAEEFGIECVGIDRSDSMIEMLEKNNNPLVSFKQKEIQVEDVDGFDLVLALNVLYHLPNCDAIIEKIKATAKNLIYSVPSKEELKVYPPIYPDEVVSRIKDLGGEVIAKIPTIRQLPRSMKWLRL